MDHKMTQDKTFSLRERVIRSRYFGSLKVAKRTLGRFTGAMDRFALQICARSRFGAVLYYLVLPSIFGREQHSVLAGRAAFERNQGNPGGASFLLRRNIHRIEKGLSIRPRKPVFALEYIAETVDIYTKVRSSYREGPSSNELLWAYDVLSLYFSLVGENEIVLRAKERFENAPIPKDLERPQDQYVHLNKRVPFSFDSIPPSPVKYEDLVSLARRRRSVRSFEPRPVARETIEKAIEVARYSPSACNRLPYTFRVLDDYALVQKAAANAGGTAGYSHMINTLVVIVGHCNAYFDERDRHLIYIDSSLASMAFMFAAETLGLATCAINWSDVEWRERRMEKLLNLGTDDRVIMLIAVGYPLSDGLIPFSSKKAVEEITQFN